jgi:hypothetical protein
MEVDTVVTEDVQETVELHVSETEFFNLCSPLPRSRLPSELPAENVEENAQQQPQPQSLLFTEIEQEGVESVCGDDADEMVVASNHPAVVTMPTQETVSTSPFSSENSMPPPIFTLPQQHPTPEVQPQPQPQQSADETLTQDQVSRILAMLDERIVEAMKREIAGERLPVYIVDQDFVTLGWKKDRITCARTSFKREIRDASQYEVSWPSRDLGVVG